ncbi:hypothetical protein, partial [Streptomyces zhihengii]
MFDGIGNNRRYREITQRSFWELALETLVDIVVSRWVWVAVGNAGTVACAVVGLVRHWSSPLSFADYGYLQLACLACQAVAVRPVVAHPLGREHLHPFDHGLGRQSGALAERR